MPICWCCTHLLEGRDRCTSRTERTNDGVGVLAATTAKRGWRNDGRPSIAWRRPPSYFIRGDHPAAVSRQVSTAASAGSAFERGGDNETESATGSAESATRALTGSSPRRLTAAGPVDGRDEYVISKPGAMLRDCQPDTAVRAGDGDDPVGLCPMKTPQDPGLLGASQGASSPSFPTRRRWGSTAIGTPAEHFDRASSPIGEIRLAVVRQPRPAEKVQHRHDGRRERALVDAAREAVPVSLLVSRRSRLDALTAQLVPFRHEPGADHR